MDQQMKLKKRQSDVEKVEPVSFEKIDIQPLVDLMEDPRNTCNSGHYGLNMSREVEKYLKKQHSQSNSLVSIKNPMQYNVFLKFLTRELEDISNRGLARRALIDPHTAYRAIRDFYFEEVVKLGHTSFKLCYDVGFNKRIYDRIRVDFVTDVDATSVKSNLDIVFQDRARTPTYVTDKYGYTAYNSSLFKNCTVDFRGRVDNFPSSIDSTITFRKGTGAFTKRGAKHQPHGSTYNTSNVSYFSLLCDYLGYNMEWIDKVENNDERFNQVKDRVNTVNLLDSNDEIIETRRKYWAKRDFRRRWKP